MSPATLQLATAAFTAGLPTLTVLAISLLNNQRLTDFERRNDQRLTGMNSNIDQRFSETNQRIESFRETLRAEMFSMEQVLDVRLKHLEESSRA